MLESGRMAAILLADIIREMSGVTDLHMFQYVYIYLSTIIIKLRSHLAALECIVHY